MDLASFWLEYGNLLVGGVVDTLAMVFISSACAYVFGLPLGVLVCVTAPGGLCPHRLLYAVLGWIVNVVRSVPFIILLVFLIPMTRVVAGTSLGVPGAVVPLVFAAIPFVGRVVEQSLLEVDHNLVEAAQSMGASNREIICRVYLREATPALIRGLPLVLICLLGYSAMAGTVGAGGLGDIAIRYGYQRYQDTVMWATIAILIVMVCVIQGLGDLGARVFDHRKQPTATKRFSIKKLACSHKVVVGLLGCFCVLAFLAHSLVFNQQNSAVLSGHQSEKTIVVGASPSPHVSILTQAKSLLAKKGYQVKIIEYSDYVQPNQALAQGDIDANYFQHRPYLENYTKHNASDLVSLGPVHFEPMCVYAGKSHSLSAVPRGAQIAIPSDATNEGRALQLLQAHGIIKLKSDVGLFATKGDIIENPHAVDIIESEAAGLPRLLSDVDYVILNANYALSSNLDKKRLIATEKKDSDAAMTYANIIAVRAREKNNPKLIALIEALRSQEIADYINRTYDGMVVSVCS